MRARGVPQDWRAALSAHHGPRFPAPDLLFRERGGAEAAGKQQPAGLFPRHGSCRGREETVFGICRRVDDAVSRTLTVGDTAVRFQDIIAVEADRIFDEDWERDDP